MGKMTYAEAEAYILGIPKFTKKNSLEHTRRLLRELGNPQDGLKIIHVAGTNGKGSVCAYLDAMLRAQGRRTGLFTSPHLVRMNERIAVDGREIGDEDFCSLTEEVLSAVRRMEAEGLSHPTFFEFLFGMSMLCFRKMEVEYAVLETGLGGRLDATTAPLHPIACVITSIGLDHTEYLGDTLAKVAREKAGIIVSGAPLFFISASEESDAVIEERASSLDVSCKKIGKDAFKILGIKDKHIAFSCGNAYYGDTPWRLGNIGAYQPGNAFLAMEVMRFLFREEGRPDLWREALAKVKWPCRMEELLPDVYVDGAHNLSAIHAFADSVPSDGKNIILFAAVQEKEYEEMIACLCRRVRADFYVAVQLQDKRAQKADILGDIFGKYTDRPVYVKASVREALSFVLERKGDRTVYCLGSLYLAGEIKGIVTGL